MTMPRVGCSGADAGDDHAATSGCAGGEAGGARARSLRCREPLVVASVDNGLRPVVPWHAASVCQFLPGWFRWWSHVPTPALFVWMMRSFGERSDFTRLTIARRMRNKRRYGRKKRNEYSRR